MKDLNIEAARCHKANRKWWTDLETGEYPILRDNEELCMLVVSEFAEALEGDRKNLMDDKLPHRKMREVELADALIRALDIAGAYGISVDGQLIPVHPWPENFAACLWRLTKALTCDETLDIAVHDTIWGIISVAKFHGLDLWGAYEEKMLYNSNRVDHTLEHRRGEHGKKY